MAGGAPGLEAGLTILELVSADRMGASFSTVLKVLPQSKASVARFLKSMVEAGYLRKEGGRYLPGLRFALMASRVRFSDHLAVVADPIVREASEKLQNTCLFIEWDHLELRCLCRHLQPQAPSLQAPGSVNAGLGGTPSGWVALVHLEKKFGRTWEGFVHSRKDAARAPLIEESLQWVRTHGFGYDNGNIFRGVRRLAAPVYGLEDELLGTIELGATEHTAPEDKVLAIGADLIGFGNRITTALRALLQGTPGGEPSGAGTRFDRPAVADRKANQI